MFIIRKSEYIVRRICYIFDMVGQEESYSQVPYQKNIVSIILKNVIINNQYSRKSYKSILITLKISQIIYFRRNIFNKTYKNMHIV